MNKKVLIIGVVLLLLIGGGGGAAFLLLKGGDADSADAADPAPALKKEPLYYEFKPAIIANFPPGERYRHLQLAVMVMTRDQAVVTQVDANSAQLRSALIMTLSDLSPSELVTLAGKEALAESIRQQLNLQLARLFGDADAGADADGVATYAERIESVLFTNFVMQ